ncbi:MAG: toxin-antitoxin system YwqK family antitoxin [Bacteroidales bacterium]|nr:toxin-antitoxin system YwqK family antitoxin [Bacteroidales bacterium]
MRVLSLIIFSLLFNLSSFAQSNVNKKDDQGRKTGKWLDYHPNGKKRYEGNFREGYEIGTFKFWNGNGQLISELLYSQKGENATARIFYSGGVVKAEGNYHKRKKDGVWKYYSKSPHVLKKEESYKNGQKDGAWRIYFRSGKLTSELYWKDDKRHGSWNDFFENGDPHVEALFENGALQGNYVVYYIGNIVAKEGEYVKGKMNGIWFFYNIKSELIRKERYDHGFLQQLAVFENGKLIEKKNHTRTEFDKDFYEGQ